MFRRVLLLLCGVAALAPFGSVLARGRSKPNVAVINTITAGFVRKGLLPGHRYRVTVRASHKTSFTVQGFQDYTWVAQKHLTEGNASLKLHGTTPHSFIIRQPVRWKLNTWIVVASVTEQHRQPLTVHFIDLGR